MATRMRFAKAKVEKPPKAPEVQKAPWKSKTTLINALSLILLCLPQVEGFVVQVEGTEQVLVWLTQIQNIVNIALRFMTKGPIGSRIALLKTGLNLMLGRGLR